MQTTKSAETINFTNVKIVLTIVDGFVDHTVQLDCSTVVLTLHTDCDKNAH